MQSEVVSSAAGQQVNYLRYHGCAPALLAGPHGRSAHVFGEGSGRGVSPSGVPGQIQVMGGP
jgi:hypothetical protein